RDALHAPAGGNIARMEKERVADSRILKPLVNDLGDRDCGLPLPVRMRHAGQRMTVNERKLTALEKYAAIGTREASAAAGPVGDHLAHGKLAGEWFALGFESN